MGEPAASQQSASHIKEDVEVPAPAIDLAHRLLRTSLEAFDASERIADISEMRIAPYRVLVECLPLRVYVYSLAGFMGEMEYKSILRSNRPAGAVFDAFELSVEAVRCGFYIYSLQACSDTTLLNSLWENLRKEAGQGVKTADLPEHHTRHHAVPSSFQMIPLRNDPEEIVQSLIGQKPPSQQLAAYEVATAEEVMKPIFAFTVTRNEYPFEREELIHFARHNEQVLRDGGLDLLAEIRGAMSDVPDVSQFDNIVDLIDVFRTQIQLVMDGRDDDVDVRSETIYWLVNILASQVESKFLSHDAAAKYFERPRYRARLGPATLRPMFLEFVRRCGTTEEQGAAKLYLILEAATLCEDAAILIAGREVLVTSRGDPSVRHRLQERCQVASERDLDEAARLFIREARSRNYTEVNDADL